MPRRPEGEVGCGHGLHGDAGVRVEDGLGIVRETVVVLAGLAPVGLGQGLHHGVPHGGRGERRGRLRAGGQPRLGPGSVF